MRLLFGISGCRLSSVQGDGERESFAGGTRKVVRRMELLDASDAIVV
jgi:hypothetical protein